MFETLPICLKCIEHFNKKQITFGSTIQCACDLHYLHSWIILFGTSKKKWHFLDPVHLASYKTKIRSMILSSLLHVSQSSISPTHTYSPIYTFYNPIVQSNKCCEHPRNRACRYIFTASKISNIKIAVFLGNPVLERLIS